MDRNTLIGLGLIGVILAVFTYVNQPSPEEIQAQQEKVQQELEQRRMLEQQNEANESAIKLSLPENVVPKLDSRGNQVKDSIGQLVYTDTLLLRDTVFIEKVVLAESAVIEKTEASDDFKGEVITLENNKIFLEISTKGGGVVGAYLKEHQTYDDFVKNEPGTITPIKLFDDENSTNQLSFSMNGEEITTGNKPFEIIKQMEDYIELRHVFDANKSISFVYSILPDNHHINYSIKMNGFEGAVLPQNVFLDWQTDLLKSERLLSEQRRTSTVFFKGVNDSYDYLSEFSDDDYSPELDVEWVAFKQSYFSTIMMPEN